ncbi:MAG: GNAT family N-acetyltransferase [Nitrospiraceae bacterium]|nr:GNAT family N-acetyltransferase [Nitrospiraceae bacterium]
MKIICISDYHEFDSLEKEWNALLEASGCQTLPLRHEWLSCFYKAFGNGARLSVLAAWEGTELAGLAPFTICTRRIRGIPVRSVSFIGDPGWTTGHVIAREPKGPFINSILDYLTKNCRWDLLYLWNMPRGEENAIIGGNLLSDLKFRSSCGANFPYIPIEGNWEEFKAAKSIKFRKVLRNKLNRINNAGQVDVRCHSGTQEIGRILPCIFELGSKSWKYRAGISISSTNENRYFYSELAGMLAPKGMVRIWVLNLNGSPAAFEYHLVLNGTIYALTAEYDEALSYLGLSPGSVLECLILEQAFKDGMREFDLGSGLHPYKLIWTNLIRRTISLSIYRETVRGHFLNAVERSLPVLKRIKEAATGSAQKQKADR